jgi:hypothetical protein
MGFEMWNLASFLPRIKCKATHQDLEERQGCLSHVFSGIWGGEKRQADESYSQGASQQFHQDVPVSKHPGPVSQLRYDPHPGNRVDRESMTLSSFAWLTASLTYKILGFSSAAVLQDAKVEPRLRCVQRQVGHLLSGKIANTIDEMRPRV